MDPHGLLCEGAEEGGRFGLLSLMTGISEEAWCASWLNELEFILWRACHGAPAEYGHQTVTPRQAELLRLLSEEANGWWVYDSDHGPIFVTKEEWLDRYREKSLPA